MKRLIVFLIIFTLSLFYLGCSKESTGIDILEYSGGLELLEYDIDKNILIDQNIHTTKKFEEQLKDFYEFSQEFFFVWNEHIEDSNLLFEKFNNVDTTLKEKITYARLIREKYMIFKDELNQITPPNIASVAYHCALDSISKRILFLKKFEEGADLQTLIKIEKEAYLYETLFWEELEKIYNYFDETSYQLKIPINNELLL
jgi:hypothetical protein